ncbi:Uncharacterised protein [Escherichia coli]|nr:Uncharacterised protein [Escherichia coli]
MSYVQPHADTSCVLTCGHQLCPIRKKQYYKNQLLVIYLYSLL